jgi:hypothetical protein
MTTEQTIAERESELKSRLTAAYARIGEATQYVENSKRGAGGGEQMAVASQRLAEAQAEAEAIAQEIEDLRASEERVTLISPNPFVNITDTNGIEFVGGVATGVRRSVAERYVYDLGGGYRIAEDEQGG